VPLSSSPPTTLATARLELRPVATDDLTRLHSLWIDPHVRRFLFDDRAITLEEAEAFVRASVRDFAERGHGLWLVLEKGRPELAGFAGLLCSDDPWPTLVYGVRPELTGRGYATEAASAVLRYALEVLRLDQVRADVDEPNTASVRVLGKLGMRQMDRRERDGRPLLYFAAP